MTDKMKHRKFGKEDMVLLYHTKDKGKAKIFAHERRWFYGRHRQGAKARVIKSSRGYEVYGN
jgi:hypothetical protein